MTEMLKLPDPIRGQKWRCWNFRFCYKSYETLWAVKRHAEL